MLKNFVNKNNLLIFSPPRSGSSLLRNILSQFLKSKIAYEPFASFQISNTKEISKKLLELSKNFVGIKHVAFKNFPFKSTEKQTIEFNQFLITKFNKIVYLLRKNYFETAMSMEISEQIQNWNIGVIFKTINFIKTIK